MNTSESISNLFNLGVKNFEIGIPPAEWGKPLIVKAVQIVTNGDNGNSQLMHNILCETVGDGIAKLTEIVKAGHKLHKEPSGIIKLNQGREN